MNIEVKKDPANKSRFNKGDFINYIGAKNSDLIVFGEDDTNVHCIFLDSGSYYGIFKAEQNTQGIIVKKHPSGDFSGIDLGDVWSR